METREFPVKGSKRKAWMTKEVIDIKYLDLAGLKAAIADAEERLTDLSLDIYGEEEYGCATAVANIEGWRLATPEEIQARKAEVAEAEERQRQWDEQQAAALKARRPELFQ